jgi:hypothetical protein
VDCCGCFILPPESYELPLIYKFSLPAFHFSINLNHFPRLMDSASFNPTSWATTTAM